MSERKNPPARPAAQPVGGGPRGPRAMGPRQPIHRESVARLLKYVAPFWPRLILVLCCIIVNAVATASAATFLGRVIDDYITPLLAQAAGGLDPDYSGLIGAILQMAGLYLLAILAVTGLGDSIDLSSLWSAGPVGGVIMLLLLSAAVFYMSKKD